MDYNDFEDSLEEEKDPEKLLKAKRIHDKLDALMGEAAEVFVDAGILEKIDQKVRSVMKRKGLNVTAANLKTLLVGFQFGMSSRDRLGDEAMQIAMGIRHMLDKAKPKVEIDITKSKPLSDEPEHGTEQPL